MSRRKALAVSVACAATLVSFGVALAATMNVGVLGFNRHRSTAVMPAAAIVTTTTAAPDPTTPIEPQVVVQQKDVFDRHVVTIPDPAPSDDSAPASAASTGSSQESDDAPRSTSTSTTVASSSSSSREREDEGESDDRPSSTTQATPPAGCRGGVLEDDGVWNCQH